MRRFHAVLLALALGVIAVAYLAHVDLWPSDAGYVYFTHARNFVAGRPFAYDQRGIPSDSVASLLFVLMLVPSEWLGVNPYFGALLLSWLGLALGVGLWTATLWQQGWREGGSLAVVAAAMLHLTLSDRNATYLVTAALETTWSPVFVLLGVLIGSRWLDHDSPQPLSTRAVGLGCGLLAPLIRPENAAVMAALLLYLLSASRARRRLLAELPALGLAMLLLLAAKYAAYGGLLPNGFYRSVAGRTWPGLPHLAAYLKEYSWAWSGLALGFVLLALLQRSQRLRGAWRPPEIHAVVMLLLAALVDLAVAPLALPLGGSGFRFQFLATFSCFALLATLAGALLRELRARLAPARRLALWDLAVPPLVLGLIAWSHFPSFAKAVERPEALSRLYQRTVAATERHHYLRFGRYLRARVPDHQKLTIAFGDTGALAYGLDGIVVDTDGLTETAVARLFPEPHGPRKTRAFLDHVLGHDPDLLVLGVRRPAGNTLRPAPDPYSPFRVPDAAVHRAYRERGYQYLCTPAMFTEVHVAVDPRSPRAGALVRAVIEYTDLSGGYRLPGGLRLAFGSEVVAFPSAPITDADLAERAARLERRFAVPHR
jgi:hypothetical protein